jgi:hypothetical protein
MVDATTDDSAKKHWSHHPLVGILLAFMLTGILGAVIAAGITYYSNKLSSDREHLAAQIDSRRTTILTASHSLYLYMAYADKLYADSANDAPPDSLMQTERLYVEALAQAVAALPSAAYISDRWRSRAANSEDAADLDVEDAASADIDRVARDGVAPLLGSLDQCVMTTYRWRLANPSSRLFTQCPTFNEALYPKIPSNFQNRLTLYMTCVDTVTRILLDLGVDPKERILDVGAEFKSLATDIHEDAGECPSLKADTTAPSK